MVPVAALSTALQHLWQLPRDLVIAPSIVFPGERDITARQDVLEVCVRCVAECAAFLTPEPLVTGPEDMEVCHMLNK